MFFFCVCVCCPLCFVIFIFGGLRMWDLLIFAGWQLWPALGRRKRDKSCNVCVERSSVKPFSLCSRWGSRDGVENEGGADESHGIRPRRYVFSMYTPVFFIFLSRPVVNVIQFFFPLLLGFIDVVLSMPNQRVSPDTLCHRHSYISYYIFGFFFYYCRWIYRWRCIRDV